MNPEWWYLRFQGERFAALELEKGAFLAISLDTLRAKMNPPPPPQVADKVLEKHLDSLGRRLYNVLAEQKFGL